MKTIRYRLWKPTNLVINGPLADKIHYIIHLIIEKKIFRQLDKDGWARLSSTLIKAHIGHKEWKVVKAFLIDNEIIKCDFSYKEGEYCEGYKLCNKYSSVKWIAHYTKNRTLIDTLLDKDKLSRFLLILSSTSKSTDHSRIVCSS